MSTRTRIPAAIEPLLRLPPEASLTILAGTLGCNPSWLTSRFVANALAKNSNSANDGHNRDCNVVFVSWLRNLAFWKNEIRRSMGLDISKAIDGKRLAFIDCLSEPLISSESDPLSAIQQSITETIGSLAHGEQACPILLVLDSPDIFLASGSATAQLLNLFMLKLRSLAHSTILTCSADQPLLNPTTQTNNISISPLETETSRFLTQQAHNARLVISVRELATGAARDISGVLQVTRSACVYDEDDSSGQGVIEELEALYLVQRDGGVKVFPRGTDH